MYVHVYAKRKSTSAERRRRRDVAVSAFGDDVDDTRRIYIRVQYRYNAPRGRERVDPAAAMIHNSSRTYLPPRVSLFLERERDPDSEEKIKVHIVSTRKRVCVRWLP